MDEDNTFEVYAANQFRYLDGTRVQDLSPAAYEWLIQDAEPPTTTIVDVQHLDWTDLTEPDTIAFHLAGTDNGTLPWELEFECQLDNGPWESCDWPIHYLPIEDVPGGDHVMLVRAIDAFDNVDPTPADYTWTRTRCPRRRSSPARRVEIDSMSATFRFAADPAEGAWFECILDLVGPFAPCPEPDANGDVIFENVPFGAHELQVRARSQGGVFDIEPAVHEWTSGNMTPPVVTIIDGPDALTTDTTATFAFTIDDPATSAQCFLDGRISRSACPA